MATPRIGHIGPPAAIWPPPLSRVNRLSADNEASYRSLRSRLARLLRSAHHHFDNILAAQISPATAYFMKRRHALGQSISHTSPLRRVASSRKAALLRRHRLMMRGGATILRLPFLPPGGKQLHFADYASTSLLGHIDAAKPLSLSASIDVSRAMTALSLAASMLLRLHAPTTFAAPRRPDRNTPH